MTIAYPEYLLWAVVFLLALGFLLYRVYNERREDLKNLLGQWRIRRFQHLYFVKSLISGTSLLIGFLFLFLALSGVTWGSVSEEDPRAGLDVALILDVSRSMDARDVTPSRREKGVEALRALLSNLPGTRFSLTFYEKEGDIRSPLTQDRGLLETELDYAGPDTRSGGGSHPSGGLATGFSTFSFPSPRHRVAVLVTDGENMGGDPGRVVQEAASRDISLFVLGVGSLEGSTIPFAGDVLKDGSSPVVTRQDRGLLQTLARVGKGEYFDLSDPGVVSRVIGLLQEKTTVSGGVRLKPVSQYRLFLYISLLGFLISMGARIIRWKKQF